MNPGTITALRAQANDSQRVNLFIDGTFALGISLTTVAREKLFVGKALAAEDLARLETVESADRALQAGLRYLEARPRSAAEIRERLKQKGFAPEATDAALARLAELGMADDQAFARFWVENRQISRPRGSAALRDELRRKGVGREAIEQVLADEALVGDDHASAWEVARAALRKYANAPDRANFTRRLGGYLQRRGYSFEVIGPIVETLWRELQDGT